MGSNRAKKEAEALRDQWSDYFMGAGAVEWQIVMVTRR